MDLYDDASDAVTDAMGAAFGAPASEATNVRAMPIRMNARQ